jgi:polysaccharide pyruvyl transferase CsaB
MKYPAPDAAASEVAQLRFDAALGSARRVLVAGGYGCGNIGDEAILSVLLAEPTLAAREVAVLSRDASALRRLHRVQAIPPTPVHVARALARCDAVVIGGGGIFSGYMGRRSMLLPVLAILASSARKRVLFRALGVYRSTPPIVARALVAAMERACFVSVRDDPSERALRSFGLRKSVLIEPDPALRLTAEPFPGHLPSGAVGFALRRVHDPSVQARLDRAFVQAIDSVAAGGNTPVLIPFSTHPSAAVERDGAYLRELQARSSSRAAIVLEGLTPRQTLGAVGRLDALIAMRFHAMVFGDLAGTPTIAVPYDEKCSVFAAAHGVSAIPMDDVTPAGLCELVARLAAARSAA